jgi:L-ribulokinase
MAAAAAEEADLRNVVDRMADRESKLYLPDPARQAAYEKLYREYARLHDYFGRGENPIMAHLTNLKLHNPQ